MSNINCTSLLIKWYASLRKGVLFSALCHFVFFTPHLLSAQQSFSMRQFTTDNGLPQNSIVGIEYDRYGYLWIATQGGICRFDGQNFKTFDMLNTPVFKSNRFEGFYAQKNGDLFFYDAVEKWYSLSPYIKIQPITESKYFLKKDDQRFFFGGLSKLPNWPAVLITKKNERLLGVARTILNEHECYVQIEDNKTYFLNNQKNIIKKLPLKDSHIHANDFLPGIFINKNFICSDKGMIKIFKDGNLVAHNKIIVAPLAVKLLEGIVRGSVKVLSSSMLKEGNIIYTVVQKADTISFSILANNINVENSEIVCTKYDSINQMIFMGTFTQGMYVFSKTQIKSLLNGNFYDVLELKDSVFLNDRETFNIYTGKRVPLKNTLNYTTLYKSNSGEIWFQMKGKLFKADTNLQATLQSTETQISKICYCESQQRFWVAFSNCLWERQKNGQFKKIIDIGINVEALFAFSKELLWAASDKGVYELDVSRRKAKQIISFSGLPIRSIFRAKDSSIWIGTYGMGMYKYANGKLFQFPIDFYGWLRNAHNFFEDKNGFFWIPTNTGLIQCLKTDLDAYIKDSTNIPYYYYYGKMSGLLSDEFNGSAQVPYAFDKYNNLVYPTTVGAVYFSPYSIVPNTGPANIYIESMEVDNLTVPFAEHIYVSPNFARLIINIGCPFFGDVKNLEIEYNIEGFNKQWYRVGHDNRMVLNRLPHGTYQLLIRKKNGFGTDNYTYKKVWLTVLPHKYETWWFFTILLIISVIFIAVVYRLRHKAMLRNKKRLENEIAVRTQDLHKSVTKLNDTISELHVSERKLLNADEVKDKVIAIILHDIKAPLSYLGFAANGFRQTLNSLSFKELENFSDVFAETTTRTNRFVEDLLQWLLSQRETFKSNISTFPINGLFEEIMALYKEIAMMRGNTIHIVSAPAIDVTTDRHILKLIIQNLIDNSIKHTNNGSISFFANISGNSIVLKVTDTGKGMDITELEKVNQPLTAGVFLANRKLGLGFVKSFIQLIEGTVRIESTLGKGTIVVLTFPL